MPDADRLLAEFIEQHLEGSKPDPWSFIDQLAGEQREELADLIDAYFVDAPRQAWDAEAFKGSSTERLTEQLGEALAGRAGLWPVILPQLRHRAEMKRSEVVARLADALGVSDREQKVEAYYHEMERGSLPSAGVSSKVLEALGRIVGVKSDLLRRMGQPLGAGVEPRAGEVYARTALAQADGIDVPSSPSEPANDPGRWDEVDELFRSGGRRTSRG